MKVWLVWWRGGSFGPSVAAVFDSEAEAMRYIAGLLRPEECWAAREHVWSKAEDFTETLFDVAEPCGI